MSNKKNKTVFGELSLFQKVFVILCFFGLISAMAGTTYTNYDSLAVKFPAIICLGVCIAITLGFTLPLFLEFIPLLMRAVIVLIMLISTSLAINTMASKEIGSAEERLTTDEEYRRLKLDYLTKSNQFQKAMDANIENAKIGYAEGARSARENYGQLKREKDVAYQLLAQRADSLKVKGSVQQEAYVETWYTLASSANIPVIRNFSKEAIQVTSTMIFSIINDNLIVIFAYIIICILGESVIIYNFRRENFLNRMFRKNKKELSERSVNSSKRLPFSKRFKAFTKRFSDSFSSQSQKNKQRKVISGEAFNGIQAIMRVKEEHPDWSCTKIGKQAAIEIGRDEPFSKGRVSKVLNHEF